MLEGNKPPVREAALLCGDGQESSSSSSLRRRGLGAAGLGPGGRSGAVAGLWQRSRAVAALGCRWHLAHVRGERGRCAGPARRVGARGEARRGVGRSRAGPSCCCLCSAARRHTPLRLAGRQPWAAGRGEAGRGRGRPGAFGPGPLALPGPWRWARGIVSLRTRRSSSARRASSLLALLGRPWQSSGSRFSLFHLENNSEIPEKG